MLNEMNIEDLSVAFLFHSASRPLEPGLGQLGKRLEDLSRESDQP